MIVEKFLTTLTPDYGKRQPFDVFRNPTSKEWREAAGRNDDVRAIIDGDDLIVWNTYGDLHYNVVRALKLGRHIIPCVIYGAPRSVAHIMVTDASKNTDWWHNAAIVEAIETGCGYLNDNFTEIELSFYDEDIVGRWDNLEDD